MSVRLCAVVPSRNHAAALPAILARLKAESVPVFLIDDGSDEPARTALAALDDPQHGVTLLRHDRNLGKGRAVAAGFRRAAEAGFTHALQVDADGQHDLAALPALLAAARAQPGALISGAPVFDRSMPLGRRIGRWITHVWVYIETLSFAISDSMCGFRVYPLAPALRLLAEERVGARMDFDTEIMVRLVWRGVRPVMVPVRVTYPPGNVSNFDLWRDNWRITCMHTRLVFAMLTRLPAVVANRPPQSAPGRHWAALAERGGYWGLLFLAAVYRLLGRTGCVIALAPIVFYFYVTDGERRKWSREFLARAFAARGESRRPNCFDVYRHFLSFAVGATDVFAAWIGALPSSSIVAEDPAELERLIADPRGAVLVVSHLGSAELSRALADGRLRGRLTVLVHTRHSENYNRLLREFRPEAAMRMIQVTEIGPDTAIALKERVERGEWIAIAGDRSPVGAPGRVVRVPFLGRDAPFPQGPWLLAFLLGCPVYILLCCREGRGWRLSLRPLAERVELPRQGREAALARAVGSYAAQLEAACLRDPFQWWNFFNFWAE